MFTYCIHIPCNLCHDVPTAGALIACPMIGISSNDLPIFPALMFDDLTAHA